MFYFTFSLIILLTAVSCGNKTGQKTSVHLTNNFIVAGQTGGVILFAQSLTLGKSFMTEISNDQEITLDSGVWDFLAISWDGSEKLTGNNRCAFSIATNLNSLEANVNLTLTSNNCLQAGPLQQEVFGTIFQNATLSAFKTLSIHTCDVLDTSGTGCQSSGTDPITGSVKVVVPLDKVIDSSPQFIASNCYSMSAVSVGERAALTPIKLPAYTTLSGPTKPIITLHTSGDCTDNDPIAYRLKDGLSPHEDQVNGNFTLVSDIDNSAANEIKVFLEHNTLTSKDAVGLELVSSNLPPTANDYATITSVDIELNNLYDNDILKVYFNDATCSDETLGLIGTLSLGAAPASQNTVTFSGYASPPLSGVAGKMSYYIKVLTSSGPSHPFTAGQTCQLIAEVIDPVDPLTPTSIFWDESSPNNTVGVTANWTVSSSTDIASQEIGFFTDAGCTISDSTVTVSNSTNSHFFTGVDAATYYFNVSAIDHAGNVTTSPCSSPMEIDITPPALPTSLIWQEGSIANVTNVNAQWILSSSADVSSQTIRYYTDASCITQEGSDVVLANNITQDMLIGATGTTYFYTLEVVDYAGNTSPTACSPVGIEIDTTPPVPATLIAGPFKDGWSDSNNVTYPTPSNSQWNPSTSPDLASQELRYYVGTNCDTSGAIFLSVPLGVSESTNSFVGAEAFAFKYKVISTDNAGNESESICSGLMTHQ